MSGSARRREAGDGEGALAYKSRFATPRRIAAENGFGLPSDADSDLNSDPGAG
jgi:hypothetical protein